MDLVFAIVMFKSDENEDCAKLGRQESWIQSAKLKLGKIGPEFSDQ
jgi:hypothetical protein